MRGTQYKFPISLQNEEARESMYGCQTLNEKLLENCHPPVGGRPEVRAFPMHIGLPHRDRLSQLDKPENEKDDCC